MKYNKTETVTDLLAQYMRAEGLETPLCEYRLLQAWPEVAGIVVAAQTKKIWIQNQKLMVQIISPTLRQELMMNRQLLVEKLNKEAGAMIINEIVVC